MAAPAEPNRRQHIGTVVVAAKVTLDRERVPTEAGVAAAWLRTAKPRLPVIAKLAVRQSLSAACAANASLGPASLVLFDVSTCP